MQTGSFANPEKIATHFHLHEGDVVADLGAGSGGYMKILADAVGKNGKVYLCEIQKQLVESLGNRAQDMHLNNVSALWCDVESIGGVKLRDRTLDAALISNALFQFEDKKTAIQETYRLVRSGGRVFVIDWTDSFGGLGPHTNAVVTETMARDLFVQNGFTFVSDFPAGDHHYGLVFRKT